MTDTQTAPLSPMTRKLALWGVLDADDRAALLALPYTLRTMEPEEIIVQEGQKATHSCLLRSGFTYRQTILANGGRQILAINMPGDMVDLQNSLLHVADHSVVALTRCAVAFIPREAVLELAFDRPAVGKAMWFDTLVDASMFRAWIANIGRRTARERIAHIICEFAIRLEAAGLGRQNHYELPMSQERLADCVGLTPVHTNRMLRDLEHDGLIDRAQRSIRIVDWPRLTATADFDPAYLHMNRPGMPQP